MLRHETNWWASSMKPVLLPRVLHNWFVACCSGEWLNDPLSLAAALLRYVPLTTLPLLVVFPSPFSVLEWRSSWHLLRLPRGLTVIGSPDRLSFDRFFWELLNWNLYSAAWKGRSNLRNKIIYNNNKISFKLTWLIIIGAIDGMRFFWLFLTLSIVLLLEFGFSCPEYECG